MKRRGVALALVVLAGCAVDEPPSRPHPAEPTQPEPEPVELPEPTCGMDLDVADAPWLPVAKAWGERWAAATGCPITFSAAGIPVRWVSELFDDDGRAIGGGTAAWIDEGKFAYCLSITISHQAQDQARLVGHEFGHCLGAVNGIDGKGHASNGIMATPSSDSRIDAAALELVCASVPCLAFNPEI